MNAMPSQAPACPAGMSNDEWALRLQLAACYRLFDWLGWTEMIYNHVTMRVPGSDAADPHYLINPFGLHYSEVTASNLVKIDRHGNKIDGSRWPVNPAGFVIHSAVHGARADAHCVMHTHTTAGIAVACKDQGLRFDNFYSAMLYGRVAYHEFEGITTNLAECPRLVASLGDKPVLILRNHGLMVAGADIATAFETMWTLQRACEVQLASDSLAGPNRPVPVSVLEKVPAQCAPFTTQTISSGQRVFDAIVRRAGIRYAELV